MINIFNTYIVDCVNGSFRATNEQLETCVDILDWMDMKYGSVVIGRMK